MEVPQAPMALSFGEVTPDKSLEIMEVAMNGWIMRAVWGAALVVWLMPVSEARARGLLGERYVAMDLIATRPGDEELRAFDDTILTLGGKLNLPVASQLDVGLAVSRSWLDGENAGVDLEAEGTSVDGGVTCHFLPDQPFDPFLSGTLGVVRSESEASAGSVKEEEDDDDFLWTAGGGIQVDLGSRAAVTPSLTYERVGEEDDVTLNIILNGWLTDAVFGFVGGGYSIDEENRSVGGGLGVGF